MKAKEIKQINNEELKKKMHELQFELIKVNAQVATGTIPKSPGQVKQMKRTIARIKTKLHKEAGLTNG